MTDDGSIAAYDAQAPALAALYDDPALNPVIGRVEHLLPEPRDGALALDVGAGSGRDAGWLRARGWEVLAVEPAAGMRAEGERRHGGPGVRWLNDRLPALDRVHRLGLAFDVVLLSAVWQHVAPGDRPRAFRKLATLMRSGAVLVMALRHGPAPADRPMHPTSAGEVEALARAHGLEIVLVRPEVDGRNRPGVSWTTVVLRMPSDGTDALPLVRGIVLGDDKSSTYKLGLLRSVALAAEYAPAAVEHATDADAVDVPLGIVALFWVRQYLPLVRLGLPQAPRNSGPDGLGFAKQGFRALLADGAGAPDLRVGVTLAGPRGRALAAALTEAAATIAAMPANFTRYPNGDRRVFEAERARAPRVDDALALDVATLRRWGRLRVPGALWRAMSRHGAWIEPMLVAEWGRLTRGYGERMGREVAPGVAEAALAWTEHARDTGLARATARRLVDAGRALECVWTGRSLGPTLLDIDHCLPWAVWPCGDLWNLVPAHPRVNRHEKRDRLPARDAFADARDRIVDWWRDAWLGDPALAARFAREVAATLPMAEGAEPDAVFAAADWRRLRLRQDQMAPEWTFHPSST